MEQQPYQSPEIRGARRDREAAGGARVLVVDDDPTVAEIVSGYLDRAGYVVDRAGDGTGALARAAAHWPDLVVLDLMLPGMDGLEVCRRMRARGPVPVIMLTARGDEDDRILGLEVGADDYVTKPFSPRELVLRVESVLRRTGPAAGARPLRAGGLTVDPGARRATKDGVELALTVREFDLLAFLLRHAGRAFGREELMREVWGWDFGDLSTVTVHVRRLRGKVEDDPARPRLIHTVWGVGYRFEGPAAVPLPLPDRAPAAEDAAPEPDGAPAEGGRAPEPDGASAVEDPAPGPDRAPSYAGTLQSPAPASPAVPGLTPASPAVSGHTPNPPAPGSPWPPGPAPGTTATSDPTAPAPPAFAPPEPAAPEAASPPEPAAPETSSAPDPDLSPPPASTPGGVLPHGPTQEP